MFAKTLIAAAAIAATAAIAAPAAEAKTNWNIEIGIGVPAYPVYDGGHDYGYGYDVEPVRPHRPRYPRHPVVDVDYDDDYGLSCGEGRRLVRRSGFRNVSAFDCDGRRFGYTAWRRGEMYRVNVDAVRGRIVAVRPAY